MRTVNGWRLLHLQDYVESRLAQLEKIVENLPKNQAEECLQEVIANLSSLEKQVDSLREDCEPVVEAVGDIGC